MDKQSKKEMMLQKLKERQSEAKTVRKIVLIAASVLAVLILSMAVGGYFYISSALKPVDAGKKEIKEIEIPMGSSTTTIANILEENEIIKNAKVFRYYIKFKNEADFQAGTYKLSQSMTTDEIVQTIQSGKLMQNAVIRMTVPEGKQLTEIAGIIADKTGRKADEVFKQMNSEAFVDEMMKAFPNLLTDRILDENVKYPLEGYLYPATYDFYVENPSLESIVTDMIKQTEQVLSEYQDAMAEQEMDAHTLLTMASMIEEEATSKTDRGKIASVFYNRLDVDMRLQTDPTVLYALGEHKDRTLYEDLKVDDPYNTYRNHGIPPGPIANAGKSSIEAALNPDDTSYLYFLANSEGEVFYSKTLEEHNKLKAEHITKKDD
ncbi:MAG: endolytic transglycosylase MltG [Bacillus sp. (in: firmicutes)]